MVIESYIEKIEDARVRSLIMASDVLIQSLLPQVVLTLKWNIPFYEYLGPFCYLNVSKGKFYVSFYNRKHLMHRPELDHSMKMVSKLFITDIQYLNNPSVSEIIVEAAMINESITHERKKR